MGTITFNDEQKKFLLEWIFFPHLETIIEQNIPSTSLQKILNNCLQLPQDEYTKRIDNFINIYRESSPNQNWQTAGDLLKNLYTLININKRFVEKLRTFPRDCDHSEISDYMRNNVVGALMEGLSKHKDDETATQEYFNSIKPSILESLSSKEHPPTFTERLNNESPSKSRKLG